MFEIVVAGMAGAGPVGHTDTGQVVLSVCGLLGCHLTHKANYSYPVL